MWHPMSKERKKWEPDALRAAVDHLDDRERKRPKECPHCAEAKARFNNVEKDLSEAEPPSASCPQCANARRMAGPLHRCAKHIDDINISKI